MVLPFKRNSMKKKSLDKLAAAFLMAIALLHEVKAQEIIPNGINSMSNPSPQMEMVNREKAMVKADEAVIEEDITISGKVTDQNGEPLPGVTISIPGTGIGTATDLNGEYVLSVPEESTLVFSFIGFETQRVVVGSQNVINIT